MCAESHPARILTVTGILPSAPSTAAAVTAAAFSGSRMSDEPSPFDVTLRTGQPMFMSIAAGSLPQKPRYSPVEMSRAASRMNSGSAPKSCTAVGMPSSTRQSGAVRIGVPALPRCS